MPTTVTLTSGETVSVALEMVCNSDQTLSRVSPTILAGVVNTGPPDEWHGIYLWHLFDGVYHYIGDVVLREHVPHNGVEIDIHTHIPMMDVLAEQKGKGGLSADARRLLQSEWEALRHSSKVPGRGKFLARSNAAAWAKP